MAKRRTDESAPFDLEHTGANHFEVLAQTSGRRFWYGRDLMQALGYDSWPSFNNTINRAIGACTTTGISVAENFVQCTRPVGGRRVPDYELSRLACCLTAINGDTSKTNVAAAQIYFIAFAEILDGVVLTADAVDRILIRQDISELEVTLNKTASHAGVEFYDRFQNAGYRGMYNMDLSELKLRKGIPDMRRSLLDFMKKDELAGNLFRLTLTEGRIKKDNLRGQAALEHVAEQVGKRVRQTLIEETGVKPETLPIGTDIRSVRKSIRSADKGFSDVDNVAKERAVEIHASNEADNALEFAATGYAPDCPECNAGSPYSHNGSVHCSSSSLASGGWIAHCNCDYCYPKGSSRN